jgi:hypothetical protein
MRKARGVALSMQSDEASQIRSTLVQDNRLATIEMGLLFLLVAVLLAWSIRNLWFGRLDMSFSSSSGSNAFFTIVGGCLFAYSFRSKLLKVAFLLLAAGSAIRIAAHYFFMANNLSNKAASGSAIARQIAYIMVLLALSSWFKSRTHPSVDPAAELLTPGG